MSSAVPRVFSFALGIVSLETESMAEQINEPPAKTIKAFWLSKGISIAKGYALEKVGLGPVVLEIPNTRIRRVTAQAERDWEQRMIELSQEKAARLEVERRREYLSAAGKIAATSPLHVSKRKQHRKHKEGKAG
jgi:hypothetical protein